MDVLSLHELELFHAFQFSRKNKNLKNSNKIFLNNFLDDTQMNENKLYRLDISKIKKKEISFSNTWNQTLSLSHTRESCLRRIQKIESIRNNFDGRSFWLPKGGLKNEACLVKLILLYLFCFSIAPIKILRFFVDRCKRWSTGFEVVIRLFVSSNKLLYYNSQCERISLFVV